MPRLSGETIDRLVELRTEGRTTAETAAELGISPRTVQKRWADHLSSAPKPDRTKHGPRGKHPSVSGHPASVLAAVEVDSEEQVLRATIAEVARRIDSPATTGAEVASLAKQLPLLWARLADVAAPKEVDPVDDIVARSASRGRPNSKEAGRPARGRKPRK